MRNSTIPTRLQSLDALRGFDMFWISGGGKIFHFLAAATGWAWANVVDHQLSHPEWNGFRAYDLIFPLFLFMAGVSTPFSLGSRIEKGVAKSELLRKTIQRGLILVALGVLYNNGLFQKEWSEMRYPSVLGRIGLAGMFAQILYLYNSQKALWYWFGGILIGYWMIMQFVPVPGCGAGLMTIECNPASYLDSMILPGRLNGGIHDPEGLLSTLPAIGTGLLGIFAGNLLRTDGRTISENRKVSILVGAGVISILLALAWNTFFPINKNLWTSSFVLLVGGLSMLLLALFYWVIDVMNYRRWTLFFVVIGMNSIVIYMIRKFIDFGYTTDALFGGLLSNFSEPVAKVYGAIAFVMVQWTFMYVLYRNKWFLKV